MANQNQNELLTDSDLQAFTRKLSATIALAKQAMELRTALSDVTSRLSAAGLVLPSAPKSAAKAAPKKAARKTAPKKTAPKKAAPKKVASGHTRQPGLSVEKVTAVLKGAKDGLSLGDLASKVGEKNKDRVAFALRKLRDEKKVKVVGTRQFAKWFAA